MATCSDYIIFNAVTSTSGHHDHLPRRDTFKICGRFCSCPTDHTFLRQRRKTLCHDHPQQILIRLTRKYYTILFRNIIIAA